VGKKRIKPGDVLEVPVGDRLVYAQFLGRHPQYGDGILLSATALDVRPTLTADLFDTGYVTFYPASVAVARGFAEVVGTLPPQLLPTRLRRAGAIGRDGKVATWVIEDDNGEVVKTRLTKEEKKLPLAEIWNHEMLLHRVSQGWRPENEG
jgi:hypothetical protein